jgi:hypothetical protein
MLPSPIRGKEEQMHAVRTAAGAAVSQALLDGFTRYLRAERGVSALTVDAYLSDVRRFLARRGGSDLGELTTAEVSKAVLGEVAGRSPESLRRYGCAHGAEGTSHRQGHPARHHTRPLPADPLLAFLDGL